MGVGQIRNVENREGRLCVASVKVVDGVERDMEMTVGGEVEYKTEKRGKKLEAVMVRLVKEVLLVERVGDTLGAGGAGWGHQE